MLRLPRPFLALTLPCSPRGRRPTRSLPHLGSRPLKASTVASKFTPRQNFKALKLVSIRTMTVPIPRTSPRGMELSSIHVGFNRCPER